MNSTTPTVQAVKLDISKRERPIVKGELLHLYFTNGNKKLEKLAAVKCLAADDIEKGQRLTIRNTYDRKYYLNRKVKAAGLNLDLNLTTKTINIPPEMAGKIEDNKALRELNEKHNYGVQYTLL
jgi:hypothetical protein